MSSKESKGLEGCENRRDNNQQLLWVCAVIIHVYIIVMKIWDLGLLDGNPSSLFDLALWLSLSLQAGSASSQKPWGGWGRTPGFMNAG